MKNVTNLDVKRHKLGLHKEASVFTVLDIYKASGYKTKLELIAVITVLTHTEKTYSDVLSFIYKLEKVENTEALISKLSKQVLEAKVLVAKQRQAIELETINEAANKDSSIETPDSETPSFLKIYRNQLITASVFIAFIFCIAFFSNSNAESNIHSTPREVIEKPQTVIYLEDIKGHKFVNVDINSITNSFLLDTGASTTLISTDFINELVKEGFVSRKNNYLGTNFFQIADGTFVNGEIWKLPYITIGGIKLYDVEVAAIRNINSSSFLLGMSTLKKLGDYTIVPNKNKILIKN
jgi:clan AA aspartic protease (TIGR02281 family)